MLHPQLNVVQSGLWIDIERGWLAASPDAIVTYENVVVGVVEIKCPFSARSMTPLEAAKTMPLFSCKAVDEKIYLKRNQNYYYQVQGQLAITHAQWCDFCVYTPHGMSIERIYFDELFWNNPVPKLDYFFDTYMIPVILKKIKFDKYVSVI